MTLRSEMNRLEYLPRMKVTVRIVILMLFSQKVNSALGDVSPNADELDLLENGTLRNAMVFRINASGSPDIPANNIYSNASVEMDQIQHGEEGNLSTNNFTGVRDRTLSFENDTPEFSFDGWDILDNNNEETEDTMICFKPQYSKNNSRYNGNSEMMAVCNISQNAMDKVHESCHSPEYSCKGRCDEMENYDGPFTCSCEPPCLINGRCCDDFRDMCPNNYLMATELRAYFGDMTHECSQIVGAILISKCPKDQRSIASPLVELCETDVVKNSHQLSRLIPVSDEWSGNHFKNKYCCKCWGMCRKMAPWVMNITFISRNDELSGKVSTSNQIEDIVNTIIEHPLQVVWTPPLNSVVYLCDICSVSKCTGCSDPYLEEKCKSTVESVRIGDKLYKNKYCYLCSKEHIDSSQNFNNLSEDNEKQINCEAVAYPYPLEGLHKHDTGLYTDYFEINVIITTMEDGTIVLSQPTAPYSDMRFPWNELRCSENESLTNVGGDGELVGAYDLNCYPESCVLPIFPYQGTCDWTMVSYFFQMNFCFSKCGDSKSWIKTTTVPFGNFDEVDSPPNELSPLQMKRGIRKFVRYLEYHASNYFKFDKMDNVNVIFINNGADLIVHFSFASLDVFHYVNRRFEMNRFLWGCAAYAFKGTPLYTSPIMCISDAHYKRSTEVEIIANVTYCMQLHPIMIEIAGLENMLYPSVTTISSSSSSSSMSLSCWLVMPGIEPLLICLAIILYIII